MQYIDNEGDPCDRSHKRQIYKLYSCLSSTSNFHTYTLAHLLKLHAFHFVYQLITLSQCLHLINQT